MQGQVTSVTKRDVETFINNCVAIRSKYAHAKILFENQAILARAAPIFFGDVHSLLNRMVILGICAITDPQKTNGNENLTVEFLSKNAHQMTDAKDKLAVGAFCDKSHAFRRKLAPARNKLIGHLDREAAIGDVSLGTASDEEWGAFWFALRDFLQIFDRLYRDPAGLFDIEDIGMISDADSLLTWLREAEKAF